MMDIVVPQVGESIVEAEIGEWFKKTGEYVNKDDLLMELETEKVNVEINADASGVLEILAEPGETVAIGAVIGRIDESAEKPTEETPDAAESEGQPASESKEQPASEAPDTAPDEGKTQQDSESAPASTGEVPVNPGAARLAAERGIDLSRVQGSGRDGRILVEDIPEAPETPAAEASATPESPAAKTSGSSTASASADPGERTTRVPMTQIRKKIAAHLMKARHETAMLTTFNDIDMSRVMELRQAYKEPFQEKHGVGLGFMSFFVKACAAALAEFPEVNASIDGSDIIYHNYYDIGVAVGSKKGLVVPVVRDADRLSFAAVESRIRDFAERANKGKLDFSDLEGGTFTISNGGIFGSLLSTPLLNPPQSGILGMHAIQERPVVRDGEIVIRPVMNIALSYDHRIIDGKQAVSFLVQVKNHVENPETLLLDI